MLENPFIGRSRPPTRAELAEALGPRVTVVWDSFLAKLAAELGVDVHEWKSYSPKAGWSLRVLRKKRTIVWLSSARGGFNATFILGEKAVQAARKTRLPQRILDALDTAPKYPEGTGLRLVVKSPTSLPALMKLATIKVAN